MAELGYGAFDLRPGAFCIEDVIYFWSPSKFYRLDGEEGVKGESVATLGLNRQIITPTPFNSNGWVAYLNQGAVYSSGSTPTDYHPNSRYLVQQVWQAEWQEAVVDACMRDHLYTLYSLQKPFWIQFDDEMSYDCVAMESIDSTRKQFVTPTYPVAYYRVADLQGQTQAEHGYYEVYYNGAPVSWETNPWRFDPEIGLLVFENAVPSDVIVGIRYLWRAYVRVRELAFTVATMAQGAYVGQVIFEQLPAPYPVERFDRLMFREPCRLCPDNRLVESNPDFDCVDAVYPAHVEQITRTGSNLVWSNFDNAKVLDNNYVTTTVADEESKELQITALLHANQFNFIGLPNDGIPRKLTYVVVTYENMSQLNGTTIRIDEVRLTKNGVPIGPNRGANIAITTTPTDISFVFVIDETYSLFYLDALQSNIGVVLGAIFDDAVGSVRIDAIKMQICYDLSDSIDEPPPPPVDCECVVTTVTGTTIDIEETTTTVIATEVFTALNIPATDYVHGVRIKALNVGINNGSDPTSCAATIEPTLRLNQSGSTGKAPYEKIDQRVAFLNHAIEGIVDGESTTQFGGPNDLWTVPFGGWATSDLNTNGLELVTSWSADCDPQDPANWSVGYTYNGTVEHSTTVEPLSYSWGSSPAGGWREHTRGDDAVPYVNVYGAVTITFTWIGGGDAPMYIPVKIYSKAVSKALNGGSSSWIGTVDNGFGDSLTTITQGGYPIEKSKEGFHDVTLTVIGGVASYTVTCSAYSFKSQPNGVGMNEVYAGILVVGELQAPVTPATTPTQIDILHSKVCQIKPAVYTNATASGSWDNSAYTGLHGEVARSKLASAITGNFALLMRDFILPTFNANTRIVGIRVDGEYRKVGAGTFSGSLTVKTHIASYNAGNVGLTLAYPTTEDWTVFSVGGNGQFWDYSDTYAETSTDYPTAIGSQVNAYTTVELRGANVVNATLELQNVTLTLFVVEVCDGL